MSPEDSVMELAKLSSSVSTIAAKFFAREVASRPASKSEACSICSV